MIQIVLKIEGRKREKSKKERKSKKVAIVHQAQKREANQKQNLENQIANQTLQSKPPSN